MYLLIKNMFKKKINYLRIIMSRQRHSKNEMKYLILIGYK